MTHTSGPWTIPTPSMGFSEIRGGKGELVFGLAAGGEGEKQPDDVCDANARLISAAPELLRVAELLVEWLDEEEGAHSLCDTARAAVAKATGA